MKNKWIFIGILFLLFPVVTAFNDELNYKKNQSREVGIEYTRDPPVHQYLSYQAYLLLSGEIKREFDGYIGSEEECVSTTCGSSSNGNLITEGAYEEDTNPNWLNHFYNPNNDNETNMLCLPIGFCYQNAYERALYLFNLSIYYYMKSNKELSYYYLGRVAHILEDMSVPAHVHLDPHWGPYGDDSYENYMAVHFREYNVSMLLGGSASTTSKSNDVNAKSNLLQDFGSSFFSENIAHSSVEDFLDNNKSLIALNNSLFLLFYDMAEISDDFDSDEGCGEVDECGRIGRCNLVGHCDINEGNHSEIGDILMPEVIRHIAGLYRLFWIEVNKDINSCGQEGDVVGKDNKCCDTFLKIVDDDCLQDYDECSPATVQEDCGENYCEMQNKYCLNKDVYVNKSCYYFECGERVCVNESVENVELVESCLRDCENGICIEDGLIVNHPVKRVYVEKEVYVKIGYFIRRQATKVNKLTYRDNGKRSVLCRNCKRFNGVRRFSEGKHSVVFKAHKNRIVVSKKRVDFYIDSKDPVIYRIRPQRGNINEDTEFYVLFREKNLRKVTFYYDIGETIRKKSLDIDDCIMDWRGRTTCGVTLSLSELEELNSQSIEFWFGVEDIAENYVESGKRSVIVRV